ETVTISGATSSDPDGTIIDYHWKVQGTAVDVSGNGPIVQNFTYDFSVGTTTVILTVRDDDQVSVSTTARVLVYPKSSNLPPVANADVPTPIQLNLAGVAPITVNATASSDPDGDPIIRYRWTEGATTFFDDAEKVHSFNLTGLGLHTLTLTVYSRSFINGTPV